MSKDEMPAKRLLEWTENLILIVKATGGYKVRSQIKLSDLELQQLMPLAEKDLRRLAVRVAVAERMLGEPPPSIHARWDEYQQRQQDALKALNLVSEEGRG